MKRALVAGAAALALIVPSGAKAFSPNDPLASRQWYLAQDKTFDAFDLLPLLPFVRVGVIDSGAELSHPELRDRMASIVGAVGNTSLIFLLSRAEAVATLHRVI